jgi:hypothetical protein
LFDYIGPLPKPLSLISNTDFIVEGYSEMKDDVSGREGEKYRESEFPFDKDFDEYKILITYENTDRVKFYTLITGGFRNLKSEYLRYKPEPFGKYSWIQRIRIAVNK